MENSGKASKKVVKRLVDDIRFFSDAVRSQSAKMVALAEGLNSAWDDPQYFKFLEYMRRLSDTLVSNTKDLDYCADKVEERELKEI